MGMRRGSGLMRIKYWGENSPI